jgi:hypothetical protein
MELLRAIPLNAHENEPPNLSFYSARLALLGHDPQYANEADAALYAANLNILRRDAPYAYFFANGYRTADAWDAEDLGFDKQYLGSLPKLKLSKGLWLASPDFDGVADTVVVDISYGDILPVVFSMHEEEFALLCLPTHLSLDEIERQIRESTSNHQAVESLLSQGGFVATLTDGIVLGVRTLDRRFGRYFTA